jgi:hypothetical protein
MTGIDLDCTVELSLIRNVKVFQHVHVPTDKPTKQRERTLQSKQQAELGEFAE